MTILLIAEHDGIRLKSEFYKTLTAAHFISDDIHVLVVGSQCQAVSEQVSMLSGVKKILMANAPEYEHQLPENMGLLINELPRIYSHIICSTSSFGKNLMPRIAAGLDVSQISNVASIFSADTFACPIYSGKFMAKVKSNEVIKVITIIASYFDETVATQKPAPIEAVTSSGITRSAKFINDVVNKSDRPPLQSARIVVSGGRGLKSIENYNLLEQLADKLGAAVGATRPIVDEGWASNDQQIGQTGKTIAPELYMALGISGAAQHVAGIKNSKIIVAINNDPEAPIFEMADYGLVAELSDVLPKLHLLM